MIKLRFNANIMFPSQKKIYARNKKKYGFKALQILPCRIFLFTLEWLKEKEGARMYYLILKTRIVVEQIKGFGIAKGKKKLTN